MESLTSNRISNDVGGSGYIMNSKFMVLVASS